MATESGKAYSVTSDPYLACLWSSLSANTIATDSLAHKQGYIYYLQPNSDWLNPCYLIGQNQAISLAEVKHRFNATQISFSQPGLPLFTIDI